ncbi:hypothetical protein niasHT_031961 [Heterodera trifolii]|uniref:Serpentine receptor class gamma n=1 Tax=Heterodera trifolii TaxID=157864 RepID=A0ABD2I194_9BILA
MASFTFFSVIQLIANAELVPFAFALIIGIPSAVLYCLELWVIIANFAEFNSAFFVIVIVRAILSLFNYVFSFFEQRFGKIGLFLPFYLKLPRFVLAFLFFVSRYIFHGENLLTSFLLLNRFTSILLPFNYEKFWRYALVPILFVTFVLPLAFTFQIFDLDMHIHVQNDNVTFTLDNNERTANDNPSYSLRAASSALAFGIICLLLNLASLFVFKFLHPKMDVFERKMTIYTVATFFGQFLMAIFTINVYLTSASQFVDEQNNSYCLTQTLFGISSEENQLLFLANFNQYPWVNDLSTIVIPAWLLLWASSKMRKIMHKKCEFLRQMSKYFVNGRRNNNKVATIKVQPIDTFKQH